MKTNTFVLDDRKVETIKKAKNETELSSMREAEIRALVNGAKANNRRVEAVEAIVDQLIASKVIQETERMNYNDLFLTNPVVGAIPI